MTSQDAPAAIPTASDDVPFRYTAELAREIELRWQDEWADRGTFFAANPSGDLTDGDGNHVAADQPAFFVMDMFPYPSGDGLHVGHPQATPQPTSSAAPPACKAAASSTPWASTPSACPPKNTPDSEPGSIPARVPPNNIDTFRRQLKSLGFSYDWSRELATTDVEYVRWTQWIFLQIYDTWFDHDRRRSSGRADQRIANPGGHQSRGW